MIHILNVIHQGLQTLKTHKNKSISTEQEGLQLNFSKRQVFFLRRQYTMLHDARYAAPHASYPMRHEAQPHTLCFTLLTTTDLSSYKQLLRSK